MIRRWPNTKFLFLKLPLGNLGKGATMTTVRFSKHLIIVSSPLMIHMDLFLPSPPNSPQPRIFPFSIPLSEPDLFLHFPLLNWNRQSKRMGRSTLIPSILHPPLLPCLLQVRVT